MKHLLLLAILLSTTNFIIGQDLITTKDENYEWLDSINNLSHDLKVKAISNRILLDTNCIYLSCGFIDNKKPICECNPLIIIDTIHVNVGCPWGMTSIQLMKFSNILRSRYFKEVRIFSDKDENAKAIYGLTSECGIIVLESKNRKQSKKLKKILRNKKYGT